MSGIERLEQWSAARAAGLLRPPTRDSHKYSRGVLGLRTGSSAYPGAAVLSAEAAWRTGIGLVRYSPALGDVAPAHGLPSPAAAVLVARPETVFAPDTAEEAGSSRVSAWLIGSGTDPAARSDAERTALLSLLAGDVPVVVDAGALGLLHERAAHRRRAPVIATPHAGEFRALWAGAGFAALPHTPTEAELAEAGAILAEELDATLLIKGSRTIAVSPAGTALATGPATPWLATAGTGDVLAGMLGALVATRAAAVQADSDLLVSLGATAALLHDAAARLASHANERPIVAFDVARAASAAFAQLRATA